MTPHIYSPEELLCVRQMPLRNEMHRKLYDRLKRDTELGDLICAHTQDFKEDHVSNSRSITTESETHQRVPSRQLDGTEGEWRYRGRTDSEQAEAQPIPAPSGIVAQKDEGFQRFYKAVISPTHVRVTAGGRIVPNTRGSVSPGPKWPGDKPNTGGAPSDHASGNMEPSPAYGFPVPPTGFAPMAPMYPGYTPTMVPGVAPMPPPFPLMPWHPSMAFRQGFPLMPSATSTSPPQVATQDINDQSKSDKRSEAGSIKAVSLQGPSPEHVMFRPGMPWVVPPNPSFYPMHYQSPPGYGLQAPLQMVVSSAADGSSQSRTYLAKDAHGSTRSAPVTYGPLSVAIAQSPVSSIRPSEITKNQISVLRNSLKYLEDQLLYNRHQVDEKALEHQVDMVKQQIRHFEKNLENQLTFESNHYPRSSSNKVHGTSRSHLGSKASITSEDSIERPSYKPSNASINSLAHSVRIKGSNEKKTSFSTGINSTKSVCAFAPVRASAKLLAARPAPEMHHGQSTGLPITAALAAPFEPQRQDSAFSDLVARRGDSLTWSEHTNAPPASNCDRKGDAESQSVTGKASINSDRALPYLVGYLPAGVNPSTARDTDYAYTRPLSDAELRARHMYWGKTPRHLQKGLPKFDGKDFYPPSPQKGRSTERGTSSSYSSRGYPASNVALDYGVSEAKAETDLFRTLEHRVPRATREPFGISTQSEAIARSSRGTDDSMIHVPEYHRPGSCTTRVGGQNSSDECQGGNNRSSSPSLPDKSSSDEAEDDKDLLFKGRRTTHRVAAKSHSNEIWRSMLRKGKTSGIAVPGAVSSTTVQGVLPLYSGYATASLTPAIANSTTPPPRIALGKVFDTVDGTMNLGERKRENLPPLGGDNPSANTARNGASFIPS